MFEKRNEPIAPLSLFIFRLLCSFTLGVLIIIVGLAIGMVGYLHFTTMPLIDAFQSAAFILSDMGPITHLETTTGKLFVSTYALFSGLVFTSVVGVIFAPLIHRFLHHFHHLGQHNKPEEASRSTEIMTSSSYSQ